VAVLGRVVVAVVVTVASLVLRMSLLRVHGNSVRHGFGLVAVALAIETHGGTEEEEGGHQAPAHPDPGHEIRPIVHRLRVSVQQLIPGAPVGVDPELGLVVLDGVPHCHGCTGEDAGRQHEEGGGGDVAHRAAPAARHTREEGEEEEEEGDDEEGHQRPRQVQAGHLVALQQRGVGVLVEDVVVDVLALGLHGGEVEAIFLGHLLRVADAEQPLGAGEVDAAGAEAVRVDRGVRELAPDGDSVDVHKLPVVSADRNREERGRYHPRDRRQGQRYG